MSFWLVSFFFFFYFNLNYCVHSVMGGGSGAALGLFLGSATHHNSVHHLDPEVLKLSTREQLRLTFRQVSEHITRLLHALFSFLFFNELDHAFIL